MTPPLPQPPLSLPGNQTKDKKKTDPNKLIHSADKYGSFFPTVTEAYVNDGINAILAVCCVSDNNTLSGEFRVAMKSNTDLKLPLNLECAMGENPFPDLKFSFPTAASDLKFMNNRWHTEWYSLQEELEAGHISIEKLVADNEAYVNLVNRVKRVLVLSDRARDCCFRLEVGCPANSDELDLNIRWLPASATFLKNHSRLNSGDVATINGGCVQIFTSIFPKSMRDRLGHFPLAPTIFVDHEMGSEDYAVCVSEYFPSILAGIRGFQDLSFQDAKKYVRSPSAHSGNVQRFKCKRKQTIDHSYAATQHASDVNMLTCLSCTFLKATRNSSLSVRFLTAQQVSNALRPFYFLVHPDLFGKHPEAQAVNEKNMKTLKNYVDTLVTDRKAPNPKDVSFYIKPRSLEEKEKNHLKIVRIRLKDVNIRETVLTILKQSMLPTGYVDKIPQSASTNSTSSHKVEYNKFDDDEFTEASDSVGFSPTDTRQPFVAWLANNINKARTRFAECEPIRLETERLQGEICYNFQLKDILWDCDWDTLNRRGSVDAFNYLASQHHDIHELLVDKTVVFGQKSGISIKGEIILYSGEVRSNWLKIVKNTPGFSKILEFLPLYERALSQSLLGIKIVQKEESTTLVDEYRTRLRKVVTSLSDFKQRNSFPNSWPETLEELELCVESDASSLMLTPEGVLTIPASTPGFLIVEFITQNLKEAGRRLKDRVSLVQEEEQLVTSCMNELGLIQLDKDYSITSQQMISCCHSMLGRVHMLRHLTHGSHIIVTRYYMVKSDGVLCVPWNLKFKDSESVKAQHYRQSYPAIS